jgi:hypothetical protein
METTITPILTRPLYAVLANLVQARINSGEKHDANGDHWFAIHTESIDNLVKEHMPSGSGFDSGTTLDLDKSTSEKLVFTTSFHHMNDVGMYDGWTDHTVTVKPSLMFGISLTISGRDRNQIKDMMYDMFAEALKTKVA